MGKNGEYELDSMKQIQARFITKLEAPLKLPSITIAVPANATRIVLSEIVNKLLIDENEKHKPEPFDFLIDGELVRRSLERLLLAKGISAEKVLEIEYVKVVAPRKEEAPCLHDDWVSSIDGTDPRFILTGCYDKCARIWKHGAVCTQVLEGHSREVMCVSILKTRGAENGYVHIATGSKDKTLRLWKFDATKSVDLQKNSAYKILRGHTDSVMSISSAPSNDMICSGSWDSSIKLWKLNDSKEEDSVEIKKRKLVSDTAEKTQSEGLAASTFAGHTNCVSSVVWSDVETIYSASKDHSIRGWDVETGNCPFSLHFDKAVNFIDIGGEGSALIAAGSSDNILRVWDPRKPGSLAPIFQFSSHTSWITSCKWHPKSANHLVSSSLDSKVMLWDLRTAWPLAVIESHKDKVLSVDWWKDDSVVSGGADSKLCISSGIPVL